jgi:hypothetical protein
VVASLRRNPRQTLIRPEGHDGDIFFGGSDKPARTSASGRAAADRAPHRRQRETRAIARARVLKVVERIDVEKVGAVWCRLPRLAAGGSGTEGSATPATRTPSPIKHRAHKRAGQCIRGRHNRDATSRARPLRAAWLTLPTTRRLGRGDGRRQRVGRTVGGFAAL